MSTLYNEIDGYAADWIENLVKAGHIADGVVDRRDIRDLGPEDVRGAAQFHAFAGIAGWSYALRLAGWSDELPVWTGSCPCQPFSAAGRRCGVADDRHLWPEWFRLIRACRPPVIFAEQVASKDGLHWLDLVCADLEGAGYTVGATDLCAASCGAPHIRQRLFVVAFRVADSNNKGPQGRSECGHGSAECTPWPSGLDGGLADGEGGGRGSRGSGVAQRRPLEPGGPCDALGVADGDGGAGGQRGEIASRGDHRSGENERPGSGLGDRDGPRSGGNPGAIPLTQVEIGIEGLAAWRVADELVPSSSTRGAWRDAEWFLCQDGTIRPAQRGSFPLVAGLPRGVGRVRAASNRTARIRGYGNSIVPQVAAEFIRLGRADGRWHRCRLCCYDMLPSWAMKEDKP